MLVLSPRLADAGLNEWTPVSLPNNMNITALALSPAFPCDKTVFLGTDGFGLFRTTEGDQEGGVWFPVNSGVPDLSITSIAVSPNYNRCDRGPAFNQGDNTVFAGTRSGSVLISVNGGNTWTASDSGLPPRTAPTNYSVATIALSPNFASDATVFVAIQGTAAGGPSAVYRSTDRGSVWFPFDAGLTDRSVQAFALSANFANDATLFLGTRFSGVYRFAGRLSRPSALPGATPTPTPLPTAAPAPAPPPGPPAPSPTPTPPARTSGDAETRDLAQIQFPHPSMRLIVTAAGALDGQLAYSVPGPVQFNYLVINNGNEALTNIRVIDGGHHDFCGDNPDTEPNEAQDDTLVGTIARIEPGQEQILTATFLIRPAGTATPGTDVTFVPRRFAGCAVADSARSGSVRAADDVVVQLVVWTSITPSNTELTDLWIWSFAVSPFFANDQTVFAGSAYGGLFKSGNAGSEGPVWRRVNSGLEPEWVAVRSIVMSPRYPVDRTVYVGTDGGIFKGIEAPDGNMQWTTISGGLLRRDVRALAISPNFLQDNIVYAASWGNDLYRLRNGGDQLTWVPQRRIINGLWAWAVSLTQDGVLFAGTWGTGPHWPSIVGRNVLSGIQGWEFPTLPGSPGGEATAFAISPTYCAGYEVFAGSWDRGLFKSTDAGSSWSAVDLPTTLPIRSIALSPNYAADRTVFVATWGGGIFRSLDGGATWGQINAGLIDGLVRAVILPTTYVQDGIAFAGTDTAGILRWDPAQSRWVTANAGIENNRIMALAASLQYASDGTLMAATWGAGVHFSFDRGATWIRSNGGLGSPYVRTVAFSPAFSSNRTVYAGTTDGAFRSNNAGQSWRRLGTSGDDLSGVDVTGFAITAGSPFTVFASTGGKGVWAYTEAFPILSAAESRLQAHLGPVLPFHTFIPATPKSRLRGIC